MTYASFLTVAIFLLPPWELRTRTDGVSPTEKEHNAQVQDSADQRQLPRVVLEARTDAIREGEGS